MSLVSDPELPSWAKGDVATYVPHVFTPDEYVQLRLTMFDAERRYVTTRCSPILAQRAAPARALPPRDTTIGSD